jgi:tetratricopeptide (TPR) repeat protein
VAAAAAAETRLAGLSYSRGQLRDAHRRLDALLDREPNNAHALLLKARWLLAEGRREDALAQATAAASASPRTAAAHYVKGLAESATHRSGEAIRSFTEVLRLNPRAAIAQVHLSRLHLSRNAIDSAVLYAEEALQNAPASIDARLALARAWAARDEMARAVAVVDTLRKRAPDVSSVHSLDGALQMILGNRAAARVAFERAFQLDSSSVEALTGLTTLDVMRGQLGMARARIDAVLAAGIESPEVLLIAGKVSLAARDLANAETMLRRAIVLDPIGIEPYALLGRVYAEQDRLVAARAEFDALAAREPANLWARLMAALITHAQNDVEGAKARYAEILRQQPRAALAANNLAAIHADARENLVQARQLAESAAEQFPTHPEVQDTLGWIYYQQHALGQSIRLFEESVAGDPKNPIYPYHLGLAHSKNGEIDRARRSLQTALKLNPALTDAQQALASLQD